MRNYRELTVEEAEALYLLGVQLEWQLGNSCCWNVDNYAGKDQLPSKETGTFRWRVRVDV